MTRIFKYLAAHWAVCLAVVALLLVQAYGDLTLPDYTSKIVDVGIQSGGIESAVPDTVRPATLEALLSAMSAPDADAARAAYTDDPAQATALGRRLMQQPGTLGLRADADRTALESAFAGADAALYQAAALQAGGLPAPADLDAAAVRPVPVLPASPDTADTLGSRAVLLVALEYQAQGVAQTVQTRYLFTVGGRMLGLTLLMVAAAVLVGLLASRVAATIARNLRRQVFSRVVSFSSAETDRFSTASLITRTTNDIQQVQMVCVILLRMVAYAPILGVGGILHVMGTDSGLTWIITLAVVLLLLLIAVLMRFAMPKFRIMQKLVDRLNLVSREILTGVMPIRAFSRESYEEQRFDRANRDLMSTQLFTNRVMAFMMPGMTLIMNGSALLIVWFGGLRMEQGALQVGELIAFITYTMQIVMSFLMLAMVAILLPRAGVAADRIDEVLHTEPSIRDPRPEQAFHDTAHRWQGEVAFHHVNFRYPGADENALEDIDFVARPGQTTAIIGATGCGKSTLLHLITRFYDVTEGSVTVDGVDVRSLPQTELHDLLGYVPQKGVLFSGTIDSNLKFGGPGITDEDAREAARIAQAEDFITAKPEGYASPIAQGGSNVSGGQKQRLSIARAIARHPRIYLFDDSFSALDYKTDVALRRALREKTGDATVIIVAQRISTVLHANQILVMEDGRIVGKGTHAQLLEHCAAYREIARSQLSNKELDLKGGEQ